MSRIYIDEAGSFKTINLTSLLTAKDVVDDFRSKGLLDDSSDWTMWELVNDSGIGKYIILSLTSVICNVSLNYLLLHSNVFTIL